MHVVMAIGVVLPAAFEWCSALVRLRLCLSTRGRSTIGGGHEAGR